MARSPGGGCQSKQVESGRTAADDRKWTVYYTVGHNSDSTVVEFLDRGGALSNDETPSREACYLGLPRGPQPAPHASD